MNDEESPHVLKPFGVPITALQIVRLFPTMASPTHLMGHRTKWARSIRTFEASVRSDWSALSSAKMLSAALAEVISSPRHSGQMAALTSRPHLHELHRAG